MDFFCKMRAFIQILSGALICPCRGINCDCMVTGPLFLRVVRPKSAVLFVSEYCM